MSSVLVSQASSLEANLALQNIQAGAPIYRQGEFGIQNTTDGQFWAMESPLVTPNYASQMGMPGSASPRVYWVMQATVMPEVPVITRPAPGLGVNTGGKLETVTQEGGVRIQRSHMPD